MKAAPTSEQTSTLNRLNDAELKDLLDLELGSEVEDRIRQTLLGPISDLLGRPKKNLRSQLTEIGFLLGTGPEGNSVSEAKYQIALEVIEALHAGSLIVDDIEDGSAFRRGGPSLHERYSMPVALNAGNWLYFWPLELIRRLDLPPATELEVYRLYHRTLLRAHFGQALDVGVAIDKVVRAKIYHTCLASLELKSGTLASFGIGFGALIAGAERDALGPLLKFGHHFGVALQMLDDLGNFTGKKDPDKKWEDLRLRRPTWVWACLAEEKETAAWTGFLTAVGRLPDETALEKWTAEHLLVINRAREKALRFLSESVTKLESEFPSSPASQKAFAIVESIKGRLVQAYG